MSQTSDPAANKPLTDEELKAVVDSPYLQYLIDQAARDRATTFLKFVASIVLPALALLGWQTSSLLSSAQKYVDAVTAEVRGSKESLKKQQDEIEAQISKLNTQRAAVEDTIKHSQEAAELSKRNADSSKSDADRSKDLADNLEPRVRRVDATAQKVDEVLRASDKLSSKYREVLDLEANLKTLQEFQVALLKSSAVEHFTLRAEQSHTFALPDYERFDAASNLITYLHFEIRVDEIADGAPVRWTVRRGDTILTGDSAGMHEWRKGGALQVQRIPLPKTGFEVRVDFLENATFLGDFVMLTVAPERGG